jgi:hypothetical protein
MKSILIFSLLFLGQVFGNAITAPAEIEKKVQETLLASGSFDSDLSWITDSNRSLVFEFLVNRVQNPGTVSPAAIKTHAEDALVRIGHEETTKRLVETLSNPNLTRSCLYSATEIIVPHAMWWVYHGSKEDPNSPNGYCMYRYPIRVNAIGVVISNIGISKKFPEATRKWVNSLDVGTSQKMNTDAFVGLITSWWEHNQTAILEKRYADATWIPLYKGRPASMNEAELAEREMDKQRQHFPWFATGATFAETAKANPWHWVGLAVLVIAAVAGFCRWLSLKKLNT